nr:DUF4241 domain-containing protein [uncultured Flavobacterium sp.]
MKKIIFSFLIINLFACNSQTKKVEPKNESLIQKSIEKNTNDEKESIVDYNLILENKKIENIEISQLSIGNLNLPSGKIIVCDPLVYTELIPLSKNVSPGNYPIKIYIAKTKESGDRFALAKLEISDKKAVKWILALRENENSNELKEDDSFFGFSVDAGLASFFDYKTGLEFEKFQKEFYKKNSTKNIYDDFFETEFKKNAVNKNDSKDVGNWINYTFPKTELNIPMFQSGFGDGLYPAYWGIDANGKITSLIIDFFVVELPELKKH